MCCASALALVVGACTASSGVGTPSASTAIDGFGVLPTQSPPTVSVAGGPIETPSSLVVTPERPRPAITDARVFMEGDSVMRGMTIGDPDALDLYVGALGWKITVDAKVGRFADEGVSNMLRRADEIHDVVVVMLGNNYDGDAPRFAGEIRDMLAGLPDVKMFVMFVVPEPKEKLREVNDVLRLAASADPRLVLVDWKGITELAPGTLSGDRIHPTAYGADVLAQAIGLILGIAPGAGPDVTLPQLGATARPPLPPGVSTNKGEGKPSNGAQPPSTGGRGSATTTATRPRATTTSVSASTGTPTTGSTAPGSRPPVSESPTSTEGSVPQATRPPTTAEGPSSSGPDPASTVSADPPPTSAHTTPTSAPTTASGPDPT